MNKKKYRSSEISSGRCKSRENDSNTDLLCRLNREAERLSETCEIPSKDGSRCIRRDRNDRFEREFWGFIDMEDWSRRDRDNDRDECRCRRDDRDDCRCRRDDRDDCRCRRDECRRDECRCRRDDCRCRRDECRCRRRDCDDGFEWNQWNQWNQWDNQCCRNNQDDGLWIIILIFFFFCGGPGFFFF